MSGIDEVLSRADNNLDKAKYAADNGETFGVAFYGFQATVTMLTGILIVLDEIKAELKKSNT